MSESLVLMLSLVAGGVLGAIFFGGLWWTVRKGTSSNQPAIWFFASMFLRMSIALTGFYFVSNGHCGRLALCLLGFVIARLAVIWLTRPSKDTQRGSAPEVRHAS